MPLRHRLLLSAGLLLLLVSSLAGAAAKRTFVASHGVDNPNCSIVAPCRNFAAAITATSAGGEVIVLDSAGYGPVTITKSVSIIVPPGIYGGISVSAGNGVTINAPGAMVVLRGLSINGQGGTHGILVQQAARVRIESCVVSSMGAVGIYHQANNAEMIVLDTISRDNGDTGVYVGAGDARIVLDHVRSEHNVNYGFYIAPVLGSMHAEATISDSVFAGNGGIGIWADSAASAQTIVSVQRTLVASNTGVGIEATSAASGSSVYLNVMRNSLSHNGGAAVIAEGILPGQVFSYVSENSADNDIFVDGSGSEMFASGNIGESILVCDDGATLRSFGDNHVSNGRDVVGCGSFSVIGAY